MLCTHMHVACHNTPTHSSTHTYTHTHTHIHTHTQADAEEICSILQQAFQLVYTEATVEHLNESINAGERGVPLTRTTMTQHEEEQGRSHCKSTS